MQSIMKHTRVPVYLPYPINVLIFVLYGSRWENIYGLDKAKIKSKDVIYSYNFHIKENIQIINL